MRSELTTVGSNHEQEVFKDVYSHYILAKQDLEDRIPDFDKKDELFRSHIDTTDWPYNAEVFDPRVFTAIFEKTSRLLARKPKGRLVPREGGDVLGAKINNEVLSFQWDETQRVGNRPMVAEWALLDQNTRKYGAGFGMAKWHYQTRLVDDLKKKGKKKREVYFDGPIFKALVNRDCLPNPSYSVIKGWFQCREYLTIDELADVNDIAQSKPIYKNLDLLRQQIGKEDEGGGDTRESNWASKNKEISNLTDYLGQDKTTKVVEIITEYQPDRWIVFAPKHGIILRDIPNPYRHGQIPIVLLKYYEVDDDLYGLSEIEPVEKLQKATNALICQYLDAVNMGLYRPLQVNPIAVQMHTLEFGPGAKWLMNTPGKDVIPYETSATGVGEFASTYRFLIGAMQEALGETSAAISGMSPGESKKTATEINDLAITRRARDNFNQIFLSEAIKKQMNLWYLMNQQFLFTDPQEKVKIIRIVGKDAIAFFQEQGLNEYGLSEEDIQQLTIPEMEGVRITPEQLATPLYPVGQGAEAIPKFMLEPGGQMGHLLLEPEDLTGSYDYIPDIETMAIPDETQIIALKGQLLEMAKDPNIAGQLAREGYQLKVKEVLEDFLEGAGMKDADKYFEQIKGGVNVPEQAGTPGAQGMPMGQANVPAGGVGAGAQAIPGGQGQAQLARPAQGQIPR